MSGASQRSEHQGDRADDRSTSLPTWLVKELERAGVVDEAIEALDEAAARDLVADPNDHGLEFLDFRTWGPSP
jgi:hypothetical protein